MNITDKQQQAFARGAKAFLLSFLGGYFMAIIGEHNFLLNQPIWTNIVGTSGITALGMWGWKLKDGAKYAPLSKEKFDYQ